MKQFVSILASVLLTHSLLATTYYVNASRPDDTGNGQSWASAKKTIQAAVIVSAAGDSVIVTNGIYAPISTANKSIKIQSVNDAELTIIDGGNTNRCATLGVADGDTNTVLIELTLRNGKSEIVNAKGGGALYGYLKHCTIIDNRAIAVQEVQYDEFGSSSRKGAAYGGGSYNSVLECCTVSGNSVSASSSLSGDSNAHGGGVYGGTLFSCSVFNNSSSARCFGNLAPCRGRPYAYGGGVYSGTIINCTLSKNTVFKRIER